MTRDVAIRIDGMLMGVLGHLDGVAHYMKGNLSPDEFAEMVKLVGAAMAETVELSSRLHAIFPEIIPNELRFDKEQES